MRILFKATALLMLTLWGPATQHCDLEAAGITLVAHGDHHDSPCKNSCAEDTCETVEGATYSKTTNTLRVLPPQMVVIPCWLELVLPAPAVIVDRAVLSADDPPEIREIARTWQFVCRTALPARAPSLIA